MRGRVGRHVGRSLLGRGRGAIVAGLALAVVAGGCGSSNGVKRDVSLFTKRQVSTCKGIDHFQAGRQIFNCQFGNGDRGCYTVDHETTPVVAVVYGVGDCPFEPPETEAGGSSD
jgi:hypothetical protein